MVLKNTQTGYDAAEKYETEHWRFFLSVFCLCVFVALSLDL